tara:strand:+ start:519 stop:785 length:267 start_codon:yes stop_codon:yes gene_type:complete
MKPKTKKQKQMDTDRIAAAAIELETAARVVYDSLTGMHDCWVTEIRALDGALSSFRGACNTAEETHTFSDTGRDDYETATWIGAYNDQ